MAFAEKLKNARKEAGMSQEALADKLGVSRQAVTKWETDRGMPDIENMIVISNLFGITVDEFLSKEKETAVRKGYLYESRTEYDIDGQKRFDMKLGGASKLLVTGNDGEKIVVHLGSDDIDTLESDFKVKIDDNRGRIDVDIHRKNTMTEAKAKESLIIEVSLPNRYLSHAEFEAHCDELSVKDIICEDMEFTGKVSKIYVDATETVFEVDCNLDMDIRIRDFSGALEINQISSTSRVTIPKNYSFRSLVKGISNSVSYESDGNPAEDFSNSDAENTIELNGLKSELVISRE
ncbi:MAG: helix-turn-helix transcriptional regulator [Lachnospiraceae bacterium]|nr:helix-turn-helix transcriptional regulator [Lachnospiraceae bacterium]